VLDSHTGCSVDTDSVSVAVVVSVLSSAYPVLQSAVWSHSVGVGSHQGENHLSLPPTGLISLAPHLFQFTLKPLWETHKVFQISALKRNTKCSAQEC
jgi:hypothetical protein